ncbi:dynein light intermediate chain 1, cytosolic [Geosmithia morbida]|uniref:Dynein light intermediate chain 1, cytosolic n=1 Tax=Geosmithia morbida TaxID=1094350 RepID=A0A9P4YZ98_9HYPO|nr:dynein light intermediate chain 1, cytosolic [Geosmithia morbida]KAF4124393.1 dynein light intermediate chain 1, cytosolic [Geosmithia morbida]
MDAAATTRGSGDADGRNGEQKKNLWTSMLESVSSGKRLPEKNLLVLGGTPETQREFLESLSASESSKRNIDRNKSPPIANSFALGYTYYDVLDADQDDADKGPISDTLARVSLYLLSQPSDKFASLVAPLLTPEAIDHTALVILLDWAQPHLWLRQICQWVRFFRSVTRQLGDEERFKMGEVMEAWKSRGRGGSSVNLDGTPSATAASGDGDSSLPLGPGEWSDALGLPLCVVCQNAQRIEVLEKTHNWKEPDFDTVLQYLRTILLRHGASLIYTSQHAASQAPSLVHSTLGITSLLKRQPLKHNVIDRDKIVVPPNWDSWGKIRVLGGDFEAEAVSQGWEEDIDEHLGSSGPCSMETLEQNRRVAGETAEPIQTESAIARYEDWCQEPGSSGGLAVVENVMNEADVAVHSDDTQDFLEGQLKILEAFKAKAAPEKSSAAALAAAAVVSDREHISEHIGPVQFNVGGIHVDADDMLQRIKDRNAYSSPEPTAETEPTVPGVTEKYDNEQLTNFFNNLINR